MAMTRDEFERRIHRNFPRAIVRVDRQEVVIETRMKFELVECLVPLEDHDY